MQSLAFRDCVLGYQSIEARRRLVREYSGPALTNVSWVLDLPRAVRSPRNGWFQEATAGLFRLSI